MSNQTSDFPKADSLSFVAAQGSGIVARLRRDGYDFVPGAAMRSRLVGAGLTDWDGYARSWEDLGPDRFMADRGTYRKRRFACFSARGAGFRPKPAQAHYQTRQDNPLNGGIARLFEPMRDAVALHPANRAILTVCRDLFVAATSVARRPAAWHIEMHQFRIEAHPGVSGKPTPEGLHRDGVDWVLVLMVRRENVTEGVSTIADAAGTILQDATLTEPLDASLVDDRRVFHGVSPIRPADPLRPAWRDVLVVTFRGEPRGDGSEA
jgi:hypothetical protein